MRTAVLVFALLGVALPVFAQDAPDPSCHPVSPATEVIVTRSDGAVMKGLLLCLGDQEVLTAAAGMVTRHQLGEVKQIRTPIDGVTDGLLKGAAVGVIMWGLLCPRCDAGMRLSGIAGWAGIGLAVDALQWDARTLYRASPRPAIAWRVRF